MEQKARSLPARLPPVESSALFSPDDPDQLAAYARGLVAHLMHIRAGGASDGYSIKTIRVAAVDLIGSYQNSGIPLDYEAYRLIAELFGPSPSERKQSATGAPVQRKSRQAYYAAMHFESDHEPDPKGIQPSSAKLYAISQHLQKLGLFSQHGADPQRSGEVTVRPWRTKDHYRRNVAFLRSITKNLRADTKKP